MACRGMTFVSLDGASHLLAQPDINITAASQDLFPLLAGRASAYEKALDWLHFSYTWDQTGAYLAPASTVLVRSVLAEGEPLFAPALQHLWWRYPGSYAPSTRSTLGPSGPDYVSEIVVADTILMEYNPLARRPSAGRQIINPLAFTSPSPR